jgi:pimeloyl-ACP methyl ester carboxylesterase
MGMQQASIGDVVLDYEVRGDGEPILFVHGGVIADWFKPLVAKPAFGSRYRLIRYHRAGYAGSGKIAGPVSVAGMASHARRLLEYLGVERAHVVGHSSGGNVALQLALDHPQSVRSLVLLEPALLVVPSGAFAPRAIERFKAGDAEAAVDIWMEGIGGPDYRAVLDRALPDAYALAVADAGTFFGQELPALRECPFGADEAARIKAPVLAVLGARSHEVSTTFSQRQELLQAWLSNVEPLVLAGVSHLMPLQDPGGLAYALARFLARQ